jgi:dsDNA-specific endonuclease/ATPase MutS2
MLEQIKDLIFKIEDDRELKSIAKYIKARRQQVGFQMKFKLKVGDNVFVDSNGITEDGTIIKINRTKAVVDLGNGEWTVPFCMIRINNG